MKVIVNNDTAGALAITTATERFDNELLITISDPVNISEIEAKFEQEITSLVVVRESESGDVELDFSEFNKLERFDRRITDESDTLSIGLSAQANE